MVYLIGCDHRNAQTYRSDSLLIAPENHGHAELKEIILATTVRYRLDLIAEEANADTQQLETERAAEVTFKQGWVFASPTVGGKQPYWPDNLMKRYIKPVARKAGITKNIGWHTFRHSFGTLLKANGEDVKTVQELLRHANSRITLDVYTQAVNSNKRAAQSKVVRMMVSNAGTISAPVGTIESGSIAVNAR